MRLRPPLIQNKVGAFLADPMLNRMLTAPKQELRVRQIMDGGKVLIANLAKGRIGDDSVDPVVLHLSHGRGCDPRTPARIQRREDLVKFAGSNGRERPVPATTGNGLRPSTKTAAPHCRQCRT